MTDREKLDFLLDILKESGKWSRSDDDPTGLELEFNDRLHKLMSVPTDRLIGPGDPEGTPVATWTHTKDENCVKRWKSTRRRVTLPDGTIKWVPLDQLRKEMLGESKFKWVLKDTAPDGEL